MSWAASSFRMPNLETRFYLKHQLNSVLQFRVIVGAVRSAYLGSAPEGASTSENEFGYVTQCSIASQHQIVCISCIARQPSCTRTLALCWWHWSFKGTAAIYKAVLKKNWLISVVAALFDIKKCKMHKFAVSIAIGQEHFGLSRKLVKLCASVRHS